MTNYEKLFQEQMKDPEFAKAYRETRLERMLNEFLENLKDKISKNEPKEDFAKHDQFNAKAPRFNTDVAQFPELSVDFKFSSISQERGFFSPELKLKSKFAPKQLTTTPPDAGGGALLNGLTGFRSYLSPRSLVQIRSARVSRVVSYHEESI